MNLNANIAQYVKTNGIPQKVLSQKTGIPESAISLALNNKRKLLADEYIEICDALCLPYDRFVNNNPRAG